MIPSQVNRVVFCLLICAAALFSYGRLTAAQEATQPARTSAAGHREDETNLDTQLYLIQATNQTAANSRMPALLDPIVKQLQATLPFKNYALAATLINRLKNGGRLSVRWVGGPMPAPASSSSTAPSFNDFTIEAVQLATSEDGGPMVRMRGFNFGSRIPIQTGTTFASGGNVSYPSINYEPTGIHTDISLREGEPVVVGTLNVSSAGDGLVVVVSVKRSPK